MNINKAKKVSSKSHELAVKYKTSVPSICLSDSDSLTFKRNWNSALFPHSIDLVAIQFLDTCAINVNLGAFHFIILTIFKPSKKYKKKRNISHLFLLIFCLAKETQMIVNFELCKINYFFFLWFMDYYRQFSICFIFLKSFPHG